MRVVISPVPKLLSIVTTRFVARRFSAFTIGPDTDLLPWRLRGGSRCRLSIGEHCVVRSLVVFERENVAISIGNRCFLGKGVVSIAEGVEIGNDVLISWGLSLQTIIHIA